MSQITDKKSLQHWDEFKKNIARDTPILDETEAEQKARVKRLLNDFEAFCKYYFPNYASAEFAKFHLRFAKKVIDNDNLYIVRAWAREHAKSVVAGLFIPLFLKFTGKARNMMYVSNSLEKAEELLMPVMLNLESNQRLIHDFGVQKSWRGWEVGKFITADRCSFRALGAGQSPRGSRNEELRPDLVLIDDIDIDEEGRNQSRIQKKWEWVEQALFPAMSISGSKRFIVIGNIISKESVVVKASRIADDYEQINILDKDGNPSWSRYSLEQVNYMLSKISYASGQKEYFNNPINEGSVFKEMTWGKVPPLSKFKFLVAYTDPSFKDSKKNDFKATGLVGELDGKFYVIKAFVEQTTTAKMIDWHYDIQDLVAQKNTVYYYIESNFMQDTFLEEFRKAGKSRGYIPINGDDRKKPDKFTRIEATLEPLNRQNRLILNEAERDNPHMRRLEEQFKAIEPNLSNHDDGPDMVEAAVFIINTKLAAMRPIVVVGAKPNLKKW
jgi:phage terminase large subunit-like protein